MGKLLYGFAAKSIQSFILQGDRLREIVGGSILVEELCTSIFEASLKECFGKDYEILSSAAGQGRAILDDPDAARRFYQIWPVIAAQHAPGLNVIQAMVEMSEGESYVAAMKKLEQSLERSRYLPSSLAEEMGPCVPLSPRTGLSAICEAPIRDDKELVDASSFRKLRASASRERDKTMDKLTGRKEGEAAIISYDEMKELGGESSYVAVAHADGNGMGVAIARLKERLEPSGLSEGLSQAIKAFSNVIDEATRSAAQEAYRTVVETDDECKKSLEKERKVPLRPIALGGDDLTIVIRADLAIKFMATYLKAFKEQTAAALSKNPGWFGDMFKEGISACAGIAFVKSSYPFHAANALAEKLCGEAKRQGRVIKLAEGKGDDVTPIPSGMMFYRVTDSLTGNLDRFLASTGGKGVGLGVYHVDDEVDAESIYRLADLDKLADAITEASKGRARQLVGMMSTESAEQIDSRFERWLEVAEPDAGEAIKQARAPFGGNDATALFDALTYIAMGKLAGQEVGA